MNTKVHAVIAKAAIPLCGSLAVAKLQEPINKEVWDDYLENIGVVDDDYTSWKKLFKWETYQDLIVFGAFMEDRTQFRSDLTAPVVENKVLKWALIEKAGGDFPHWVEHFWNKDLKKGKGLTIKTDYISQLLIEALGFDNVFGEALTDISIDLVDMLAKPIALITDGSTTLGSFRSAPERAQDYWDILKKQYSQGKYEQAFFNLGKVCHLLADMGTPAHVLNDPHIGFGVLQGILDGLNINLHLPDDFQYYTAVDDDQYESFTGLTIESELDKLPDYSNCESTLPEYWNLSVDNSFPVYKKDWTLFDYMESMASITRKYDSDDCDGTGSGIPYHWDHFHIYEPSSWSMERQWNGDLTEYACTQLAHDLIPATICHTAGLLLRFFDEMGMTYSSAFPSVEVSGRKMYVKDDTDPFAEGEIYLTFGMSNGIQVSYSRQKLESGETGTLTRNKNHRSLYFTVPDTASRYFSVLSSAYDNDDCWFVKDREKMGTTYHTFNVDELDKDSDYTDEASKYSITYNIKVGKELSKPVLLTSKVKEITPARLAAFKRTKYVEGSNTLSTPVFLNLSTMNRHMPTDKHQPCKTFLRAKDNEHIQKFYMKEDELFTPIKEDTIENMKHMAKEFKRTDLLKRIESLEAENAPEIVAMKQKTSFNRVLHSKHSDLLDKEELKSMNMTKLNHAFGCTCSCCR